MISMKPYVDKKCLFQNCVFNRHVPAECSSFPYVSKINDYLQDNYDYFLLCFSGQGDKIYTDKVSRWTAYFQEDVLSTNNYEPELSPFFSKVRQYPNFYNRSREYANNITDNLIAGFCLGDLMMEDDILRDYVEETFCGIEHNDVRALLNYRVFGTMRNIQLSVAFGELEKQLQMFFNWN